MSGKAMGAETILFLSVIFPIFKGLHKFGYFLIILFIPSEIEKAQISKNCRLFNYRHETIRESYFSGDTYIAPTGHASSQRAQHMQSSEYNAIALSASISILITSTGQVYTQSLQPTHLSLSIG
jgi:hypothetical protein